MTSLVERLRLVADGLKRGKWLVAEDEAKTIIEASASIEALVSSLSEFLPILEAASAALACEGEILNSEGEDMFDRARAALKRAQS